jgi:hypothetical protein
MTHAPGKWETGDDGDTLRVTLYTHRPDPVRTFRMAVCHMHATGATQRYTDIYAGEYATLYAPAHGFGPCPVSGDSTGHAVADRLARARANADVMRRRAHRELAVARKAYDA